MSINLTDELLAKTKKGKIASAKQVFLEGDQENLQQIGEKTHQLEDAIKDISVSGGASTATAVSYNNETSGMTAITAQGAIDELADKNKKQDAAIGTKAEKDDVNIELDKKFNKEDIAQELGESKDKVVSQFALPFREIESPEFLHCIVDAENHFLFGIQQDGSVEWGKGIPSPIRAKLQEIINQSQQDKTDLTEAINSAKEELSASIAELQQNKVDKEEGKSLIDNEVKYCFNLIENDEWICAMTDSEDRVLYGIYRDTGKSYFPLNEMYHVERNAEYLAVWLDSENRILMGIRKDGKIIGEIHACEVLEKLLNKLQERVKTLEDNLHVFSLKDNPEFLAIETDSEEKVLSATYPDGSHYAYNLKSETIDKKVDKEVGKSLIDENVAKIQSVMEDPEGRMEVTTDKDGKIVGYRDSVGKRHEHALQVKQFYENEKKVTYATKDYVNAKAEELSEIDLSEIDGVVDYSLKNLFDKSNIRTYDSDFAAKVFAAIGRKTGETGCYSNNIPCKEGDWFTRNDFGTGIVVVLDNNDNIIGDIKNVAYKPTFQIKAAKGQDFSNVKSVVMVVMLNALDTQRIVKAKYVPSKEEDAIRIPKLKIGQENIELGITTYVKSSSGRFYSIGVDDSSDTPQISLTKLDGIPTSELPSDFPKFSMTGDFSDYYDSLLMCPISGGASYLFEVGKNGMVTRFRKSLANCPKTIVENGIRYYYGINGSMNVSSGKLFIYKGNGETFNVVKGNVTDTEGNLLEPHDCCVISVNPLHVITQRYVENQTTIVDGTARTITSLVLEEQYDGNRVWQWNSADYPELWKDSHYKGNNTDYLHNNTISLDNDGNLLLNNKQANQMLVIERSWDGSSHTGSIGNILWKIGGNRGDGYDYDVATRIKTTEEQQWFESHDAIVREDGVYTMFDNRKSYPSRIIEFKVDKAEKNLTDFKAYTYKNYGGRYMGSVDKCAENIFLVSWGSFRSTESSNIGIYDFKNNEAIFELNFENKAYNAYRVYGVKL